MPELAREAFRAIADCTYDWESWVGPGGETRWVNPAVERLTGYSAAECLALPAYPLALVHEADRDKIQQALVSAAEGSAGNDLEFRVCHRDGSVRWAAMSWQPLTGSAGQRLGYRTSVRDITERKRAEDRLRMALGRAEAADQARAAFLANVSHELRTPIHNLLGYTDLLARTRLTAKQRNWVAILQDQGSVLLRLVDDLLQAASHGLSGRSRETARFELAELVSSTTEAHRPRAEAKGLELTVDVESAHTDISADAHAIGQILRNLLDNAIKFTDGGWIRVEAAVDERPEGPIASLAVEDSGRGMEPSAIAELFRPFARAETGRTAVEGVGLGLAIVDQLCRDLEGRVEVESQVGRGTRVHIALPVTTALGGPERAAIVPPRRAIALRVLVVDDQPLGRELAREMLRLLGCEVDTAADAREAISRAYDGGYELILMDLHMPGLDGAAAAHLIRAQAHDRGNMPRIVAMTADAFARPELEGFDGRLVKPVSAKALEQLLQDESPPQEEAPRSPAPLEIDRERLKEFLATRTADGKSFLERFARPALRDLERLGTQLEQEVATAPPAALAQLVHAIKGAGALIGAERVVGLAATAQHLLEEGQLEELRQRAEELVHAIQAAARAFARELEAVGA